ncbi:NCK-interacting with SH3 domain-like [Paramuricea clavata]|nr:NCK-interacting with SH3 domain-like [Paramuricea clavata]
MGATHSSESNIPRQPNRPAPDPPGGGKKRKAPEPPKQSNIPSTIGSELVEQIRISTGLTHAKSITAVETVLMHLRHRAPTISNEADYILESLYYSQENSSNVSEEELLSTHDGRSLHALVQELVKCKEDSQQRSWALHEDEGVITKCLTDVISIVNGANPHVCLAVIRQDSYDGLNALVEYYQMETRTSLRHLLLQVFSGCCSLGPEVVSQLLCTILPVELARDMQADIKNLEKLVSSARLCTMIFSTGEAIPYQHYEYLNKKFVEYLVNTVENPPCSKDDEDTLVNAFVTLILSYNQHFEDVKKNIVMQVLSDRGTSKTLTEKLMLLVNRGDDPVNIFGYLDRCPDSLLKFFEDIFSSETTSGLFFTNDLMVLIDIVFRQVSDLSPGDELRTEYLSLLHSILTTTNYSEYKHRHNELGICLSRINEEEGPDVMKDQLIVNEIFKTFSGLF